VSEMSQVPSRRTASVVSHCRACSAEITFVAFVYQENGIRGEPLPGVFRRVCPLHTNGRTSTRIHFMQ